VLQASGLVYLIYTIQPLLVGIILVLTLTLHSSSLDKCFGLLSVLPGVHRQSLDILARATQFGTLVQAVKLGTYTVQRGLHNMIEYRVLASPTDPEPRGVLKTNLTCH